MLINFLFRLNYIRPFYHFPSFFSTIAYYFNFILLSLIKGFTQNLAYSLSLLTIAMEVQLLILE